MNQQLVLKQGYTHANRLNINCWGEGCSSQGSLWRVTGLGADLVALQHSSLYWGDRAQPSFLSWACSWAQCLQVLDTHSPRSRLAQLWQLALADFCARDGQVFPSGFDGFQSIGVISSKEPYHSMGRGQKRDFPHKPFHVKDRFSNCLKFLTGAHVSGLS